MGFRQGVTTAEENRIKHLVSEGLSWPDIVGLVQGTIESTKSSPVSPAFLDGVDLKTVKANIYEPYVKKLAEAKKVGFDTIHKHEAHLKSAQVKKSTNEKLRDETDALREQLDEANKKLEAARADDLIGKKR